MYASVAHFILLEVQSSHSEVAFHIVAKCRTQDCTTLIKTAVGHVFMWCVERVVVGEELKKREPQHSYQNVLSITF